MSDLKFECPSCGQHLECEKAWGGDVIHCPRCCVALRIPFSDGTLPGSFTRAELVDALPAQNNLPEAVQENQPQTKAPAASPDIPREVRCICPECRAELRVPTPTTPATQVSSPIAELVRKAPAPKAPDPAASTPAQSEKHDSLGHLSPEERERQIAAAREAHPVQVNPPMKPRLDYVLSGKPPSEKEKAEG